MSRKLPALTPMRLAVVEWVDAHSGFGDWCGAKFAKKGADKDLVIFSAGYVLTKNARRVVLCQSVDHDNAKVSDTITIPRACIKRVRTLR